MTSTGNNEPEIIDLTTISESSSESGDDETPRVPPLEDGSDTSEVEIQLNEETRSQLKNIINTASSTLLRQILVELIDTEQAVEIALTREFVTLNRETHAIVPRWEACQNCEEDFDVNIQREQGECRFHPGVFSLLSLGAKMSGLPSISFFDILGDLETDEHFFGDHDERIHGPMDTEENRASFPEGFTWSCCEEHANAEGCVAEEHRPAVPRKRRRL